MMGTSERARTSRQISSPSRPGSIRSSSTTSQRPRSASSSPRRPSATWVTATPWPVRYSAVSVARRTSSSTRRAVRAGSVTSGILSAGGYFFFPPSPVASAVPPLGLLGDLLPLRGREDVVHVCGAVHGGVREGPRRLDPLVHDRVEPGAVHGLGLPGRQQLP